MKTSVSLTTLGVFAFAMAAPASACDMHGAGGWFGVPGSHWQNFSPRASLMDPTMMHMEDEPLMTAVPKFERVKPTFANAADRASRAARTKVMMKPDPADDESAKDQAEESDQTASKRVILEANAQTIGQ